MSTTSTYSMKVLKCEKVVVFKDRAEVKRSLKAKLKKGESEITLNDVSGCIDRDSVRIEGLGSATVLDVVCQSKQVQAKNLTNNEKVQDLLKEIKELELRREILNAKLQRFERQTNVLNEFALNLAKKNEPGKEVKESSKENVNNFFEFLDSYTNRLEFLDKQKSIIQSEINNNEEKLIVTNENYSRISSTHNYNEAM